MDSSYERNIPLVFAMNAAWMFLVLMPVVVPFFQSRGLSMTEIFILQSVFGGVLLLFEVPSGYAADVFGRKKTLVLAGALHGLGFSLYLIQGGFWPLLAAEVVLALALSLFSGTDVAMVYDSLAASGSDKTPSKEIGKSIFHQQMGEALGGLVGGWLAMKSLELPAAAQAGVAWLPILAALGMREPPRPALDPEKHRDNISAIWKNLFRHSPFLSFVIANSVLFGAATLTAVWAFQSYWQSLQIPLSSFGVLWAVSNAATALTARHAHKIERGIGFKAAVCLMAFLPIAGYLGMSLIGAAWGAWLCVLFQISRGLNSVLMRDALNRRVPSDMRATANSVVSLGVRSAFVVLGPVVGFVIDRNGVQAAFLGLAVLFAAAFLALTPPLLREIDRL